MRDLPFPPRRRRAKPISAPLLNSHIEQGCVLESNGHRLALVNAIVGQRRYTVTYQRRVQPCAGNNANGLSSRYGACSSVVFSAVVSIEKPNSMAIPGINVRQSEPQPNTVNAVLENHIYNRLPKYTDAAVLREPLPNSWKTICAQSAMNGYQYPYRFVDDAPVPMNAELVAAPHQLCETEQLNYRISYMAQVMTRKFSRRASSTCMIFVPSINGTGHNPAERTNIPSC